MNIIRYTYDQFIEHRDLVDENTIELKQKLENISDIINNINKLYYDKKFKTNKKKIVLNDSKQWRLNKTIINKNINNDIDKYLYEINSLLNKISTKNYDNIINKITVYFNKEIDDIKTLIVPIVDKIFTKSVMQPTYCPLYVRFIKLINEKFNINDIINNKCLEYKNVLEQNDSNNEQNDSNNEQNDSNNEQNDSNNEQKKYDKFCEDNKIKIVKVGYSQFIGELFNNNIISKEIILDNINNFIETYKFLINQDKLNIELIESIIICLDKLITTTFTNLNQNINIDYLWNNRSKLCKRLQYKIDDIKEFINK